MNIVTLDFETYWAKDYTLTNLSSIEYINDPRFEAISVAIKINNEPTTVVFGEDQIRERLESINWRAHAAVAHNGNEFDFPILVWKFDCHPALFIDTAALWRPKRQSIDGVSLKALSTAFGLTTKDNTILISTQGKRYVDLDLNEMRDMARYNKIDVDNCYELLRRLRSWTPKHEFALSDMTARMFCYPRLEADTELLESTLAQVAVDKRAVLESVCEILGVVDIEDAKAQLMSQPKFAAVLRSLGVEPATKISKTTGRETLALAKSDQEFLALLEHPDPKIQTVAAARIDAKSTLLETRLQTMLACARAMNGAMPIPLAYHSATTGRWGGRIYNCFTGDTEVLTPDGWRSFESWTANPSPIMQWWPEGRLSFEATPGVLVADYHGDVVDIEAVCVSCTVTPDHRMVSAPLRAGEAPKERTAGWVASHSGLDRIPASGVWGGSSDELVGEAAVRLAVALSADGYVTGHKVRVGLRRPRKIERMKQLLDTAGCRYKIETKAPQPGHTGEHDTVCYVVDRPRLGKGFGPWVLSLSRTELDALVDELRHWDGQRHHKSGSLCFWTSDTEQAGWVQTALALSGVVSTIRTYPSRKPGHKDKILVYARSEQFTSIDTARHITKKAHNGPVYCASVESSYIMIRRNNKVSVVGQCQNLPRIPRDKAGEIIHKPTNALRMSLRAPKGHAVVVSDLSGIELRVNHYLWNVRSTQELYEQDPQADLYKEFAAALYAKDKDAVTKDERQLAKVAQLGLGFGAGAKTFRKVAKLMGGVDLDEEESARVVAAWRAKYVDIVRGWKNCDRLVNAMYSAVTYSPDPRGLVETTTPFEVRLPSGRSLHYPNLRLQYNNDTDKQEMVYGFGKNTSKVYAGLADENIVQAIARDVIAYHALEIRRQTGYAPAHMVHDELVYVAPESEAPALLDEVNKIMRKPPAWLPGIVLYSEGDIAPCYGEAK